eukprot:713626-Prymnesium_polylepis.1
MYARARPGSSKTQSSEVLPCFARYSENALTSIMAAQIPLTPYRTAGTTRMSVIMTPKMQRATYRAIITQAACMYFLEVEIRIDQKKK